MVFSPTIQSYQARYGLAVPRVVAAALLRAYSEKRVPLPVQDAADWYSTGGRYWQLVWNVCGWRVAGDKFYGDKSLAWAQPMPVGMSREFWRELTNLAAASDRWQLAQGIDTTPPDVDVSALTHRSADWRRFFELHPIWSLPSKPKSVALVGFLKEAWKQLQEWYRKRYPGRPPLPPALPSMSGAGVGLVVVALLVASSRRGRRR